MAQGLRDLLKKQHKFGAPDNLLKANVTGASDSLDEFQMCVRSILTSSKNPLHVSELESDYRKLTGKRFPMCQLGFSSAIDLLKGIPEACSVEDDHTNDPVVHVKTSKSGHILDLVKKSKDKPKIAVRNSTPKEVFVPFNIQDGIREILYGKIKIKKEEFYKLLEEKYDLHFMGLSVPVEVLIRRLPHILHDNGLFVKSSYKIQKHEIQVPEYLHFDGELVIPSYRLSKWEIEIATNICTLIKEKSVIHVSNIPSMYFKRFGKKLDWVRFGFESMWWFVKLLPGDFQMIQTESGCVIASLEVDMSGTTDVRELTEENFCGDSVYNEILMKIKRLVLEFHQGLNTKHLESAYETYFHEKLVIRTDFDKFLLHLQDLNIIALKESKKSVIIYPISIYDVPKCKLKVQEVPNFQLPEDIMKSGKLLRSLDFGEVVSIDCNRFCAGYVTSIISPNNFYVRVIRFGINYKSQLDEKYTHLKKRMKKFYAYASEQYCLSESCLKLDMVCAVCVKGEWERAQIVDIVKDGRIRVTLLDVGGSYEVTLLNLRYLKENFAQLPCFACKATLFNIQPVEQNWSLNAIQTFRKLTAHGGETPKEMSVTIIRRNKTPVLQVVLTDVHNQRELHIGDELVNLHCAAFICEDRDALLRRWF